MFPDGAIRQRAGQPWNYFSDGFTHIKKPHLNLRTGKTMKLSCPPFFPSRKKQRPNDESSAGQGNESIQIRPPYLAPVPTSPATPTAVFGPGEINGAIPPTITLASTQGGV